MEDQSVGLYLLSETTKVINREYKYRLKPIDDKNLSQIIADIISGLVKYYSNTRLRQKADVASRQMNLSIAKATEIIDGDRTFELEDEERSL